MKYFIDTEFIEGKQDKTFLGIKYGETKPTIDLISIGIVSDFYIANMDMDTQFEYVNKYGFNREDDTKVIREYYAISKDFNLKTAWKNEWVRENVLKQIFIVLINTDTRGKEPVYYEKMSNIFYNDMKYKHFTQKKLKLLLNKYGKTNKQIAQEIIEFIDSTPTLLNNRFNSVNIPKPEFYGYYSDYDWVVFCQLFGTMMNLPKGFPMYCKDLKQTLDEKADSLPKRDGVYSPMYYTDGRAGVFACVTLEDHPNYPKQTNEHNALADAKWNYELYKFLNTL